MCAGLRAVARALPEEPGQLRAEALERAEGGQQIAVCTAPGSPWHPLKQRGAEVPRAPVGPTPALHRASALAEVAARERIIRERGLGPGVFAERVEEREVKWLGRAVAVYAADVRAPGADLGSIVLDQGAHRTEGREHLSREFRWGAGGHQQRRSMESITQTPLRRILIPVPEASTKVEGRPPGVRPPSMMRSMHPESAK